MDNNTSDNNQKKTSPIIWIIIIAVIIAIIIAVIVGLALSGVFNKGNTPTPSAQTGPIVYPGAPTSTGYYTKAQNIAKLPANLDLDNLPSGNALNNILRQIGISERQGYNNSDTETLESTLINYSNLQTRSILRNNTTYMGTKYVTSGNNVILFLDDFIMSRNNITDFTLMNVTTPNEETFKIFKFLSDLYDTMPDIQIDNTINNLYIYGRGFGAGLGYLCYFKSINKGTKECLFEGYPAMTGDINNVVSSINSPSNRNIFYNTLQDPMIDLVKSTEMNAGTPIHIDYIPYSTIFTYNTTDQPTFKIHEIINYLE